MHGRGRGEGAGDGTGLGSGLGAGVGTSVGLRLARALASSFMTVWPLARCNSKNGEACFQRVGTLGRISRG